MSQSIPLGAALRIDVQNVIESIYAHGVVLEIQKFLPERLALCNEMCEIVERLVERERFPELNLFSRADDNLGGQKI